MFRNFVTNHPLATNTILAIACSTLIANKLCVSPESNSTDRDMTETAATNKDTFSATIFTASMMALALTTMFHSGYHLYTIFAENRRQRMLDQMLTVKQPGHNLNDQQINAITNREYSAPAA